MDEVLAVSEMFQDHEGIDNTTMQRRFVAEILVHFLQV